MSKLNDKPLNEHYKKYYETNRRSQQKYYQKNKEASLLRSRNCYNNNKTFRENKLKQMSEYRARKRAEKQLLREVPTIS